MKISIDGWETGIKFVAGHFLPTIEKCSRLHGHNYAMGLIIEGEPDRNGIILDFIELKKAAHRIVDSIDHKMVLPSDGTSMKITKFGEEYTVKFNGKRYVIPASDVVILPLINVSAEELSRYFAFELKKIGVFGKNIYSFTVIVSEGRGQEALWEERLR
ncbi:MAG: 6-carboxytetrahydropterin synthase [Candidatus Thermoplasmatota archaeon]|jgi:6-pyruvoyltetrahydropterin/6-carboxytetrahydropterin synthase|nr:6-carboxytetrahydropterin synthase [Candidatus Sysuiplasma jiujiangense]MBX8641007.1 6-carboxytetrahydropterin synthase [Candidatus Sysuiplasma jiujiangense]MCL4318026.1 6-carboxytetrahydropterin synthase [Candidatus Thermoplasmatota archaeon]MCL5253944.1 6-carboxytetrahydropterin synthase [Candidatus Thermoplasmatota archaeon]